MFGTISSGKSDQPDIPDIFPVLSGFRAGRTGHLPRHVSSLSGRGCKSGAGMLWELKVTHASLGAHADAAAFGADPNAIGVA